MPAQNFTRIYNHSKDDYIDLLDKNFELETAKFKKEIKTTIDYWKIFSQQIQADIINSDYDFIKLIDWAAQLEESLAVNDFFPSIENIASFISMKSFNHNHVIPAYTKYTKRMLDEIGYKNPNTNIMVSGHNITFTNKFLDISTSKKEIDNKEFKIVRIQTHDDDGNSSFIDVKVRKFERKKFLFDVLTLPEFWRNFHFVSRKKKNSGAIIHPAYEINKSLMSFYTPGKNFSISSHVGKNKKEIFENVKSNMPLSISVGSFAMHLFFTQPGLVLPLTASEQLWSKDQEPIMTITISNNEVNLITVNYSDSSTLNKQVLEEFSESFSEREQSFAKFYDLGQYSGGQYLLTTTEEFAFVYETNMIELFDSLSKLDKLTNI